MTWSAPAMTSQRTARMVNDMAATPPLVKSLARAAAALMVALLGLAATPAAAQVALGAPAWTQVATATTTSPVSGVFAKPTTGSNRVILVAVLAQYSVTTTAFNAPPVVTYGSTTPQTATLIASSGTTASRQKVWIGYLTEAQINAAGGTATLAATLPTTSLTQSALYAAVYNNVNQGTITNGSGAASVGTASASAAPGTVAWLAGGLSVGLVNTQSTTATTTFPAAYTKRVNDVTVGTLRVAIGDGTRAAAGSAPDSVTLSASSLWATANVALNPATVTLGDGTNPGNTAITAGAVGAIDTFTLTSSTAATSITSLTATLAGNTGLTNLFVHSTATCSGGTTFGTVSGPLAGANAITLTGLTAGTSATSFYLCGTAATVAASVPVTATVTSVTAAGYVVAGSDATSSTLTVNAPPATTITIGNGSAEPVSSSVTAGGVGGIDAFSVQASSGTATITAVTVGLTAGSAALTSLFINSAGNCGGTTFGTLSSGLVVGNNTITLGTSLSATTTSSSTNYYVCGTAGTVATATTVTGNVAAVTAAGYTSTDSDAVNATLTVNPAPATSLAVGNGVSEPPSALPASPLCPAGAATLIDAFTLQAFGVDDVVTRVTVSLLPAGAWVNVATVEITNGAGTTAYGSAIPGGDTVNVYVTGVAPTVAAGAVAYAVRVKPRSHLAMPAPNAGQQFATTATVTSVASNNVRSYGDTGSATITIDNLSPGEISWSGVTIGATSIQLNWTTATDVVVLRKQGGPVTDAPVEGTTYTAGGTVGASTVACAGTMALCNSTPLAAGTAWYFRVFTRDTCGNYSVGSPVGPLFPGGLNEGNPTAGTLAPVVAIINPLNPAVVTNLGAVGFKVQVRAFSRLNGTTAQPLTAVRLKAATAAQTFTASCTNALADYPIALTLNPNYPSSSAAGTDNHGIYEATVGTTQLGASKGAFTLRACAVSTGGTVLSGPVGLTVNDASAGAPKGDGNLLVRDNGGQLCNDCHLLATHASVTVGNSYGSWYADCRDCHTPHNTTNVMLVRQQIQPPGTNGPQPPRTVVFSNRTTGYSAAGGVNAVASAAFANGDGSGVCQVCHTRTTYYRADGTLAGAHNPSAACSSCHAHDKGLKASCNTCHGAKGAYAPIAPGADSLVSVAPPTAADGLTTTGVRVGAHQAHVNGRVAGTPTYRTNAIICADCHIIPNTHNGTRDAAWSLLATNTIINGTSFAVAPTPAAGLNAYTATWELTPTCTNACHGANIPSNAVKPAPSWTSAVTLTCTSCHGAPPLLTITANQTHPQNSSCGSCHGAGYAVAAVNKLTHINGTLNRTTTGCTACHGELGAPGVTLTLLTVKSAPGGSGSGTNSYDTTGAVTGGNAIGAHKAHLVGAGAGTTPRWRSTAIACTECHLLPPGDTDMTHATGSGTGGARATLSFGALANDNAFEVKAAAYARPTCSNVYCHNPKSTDTAATAKTPNWTGATTVAQCGSCHGLPPVTGGSHPAATECGSCHLGYITTGLPTAASTIAAVNQLAHMNGVLDGGGDCISCHTGTRGTRRAIVPEFALAWSHKRSAAGAVSKWDCVVCHMEGDPVSGNPSGVHNNGVIDLRDPDTGSTIEGVTFAQASATDPGAYTSTGTPLTFAKFSRNLGSATIEPATAAIMINQCLKCHDADGALSSLARVPTPVMPLASAAKPFGTTISGAAYTGTNVTAGGTPGGVVDVSASFRTVNSSYHPILGKQNNSYVGNARLYAPWNTLSPGKTGGIINTAAAWGFLISCWDCHAPLGTASTVTLTGTVTAHGGATTLRQAYRVVNATNLCTVCHNVTVGGNNHGAGSAWASSGHATPGGIAKTSCYRCHGSSESATSPARPIPAQDAHGFDYFAPPMGADRLWPVLATETYRPYAFMRSAGATTGMWKTTSPKPLSGPGVPAGSATCGGNAALGTGCGSQNHGAYTPGGVF